MALWMAKDTQWRTAPAREDCCAQATGAGGAGCNERAPRAAAAGGPEAAAGAGAPAGAAAAAAAVAAALAAFRAAVARIAACPSWWRRAGFICTAAA